MCRSDSKVQDGVSGGFWGWRAGRDGGAGRVGAVRLPCKPLPRPVLTAGLCVLPV